MLVKAGMVLVPLLLVLLSGPSLVADAVDEPMPLNVVLLGDSYSAGNGAGDYDAGPVDCYRSRSNWANRYVNWLDTNGFKVSFDNRACSDAETEHVHSRRFMDAKHISASLLGSWTEGPVLERILKRRCPRPNSLDESYSIEVLTLFYDPLFDTTMVEAECSRYLAAQIDAVNEETDLVLLTIGGNDGGFGNIVRSCFTLLRTKAGCESNVVAADDLIADGTLGQRLSGILMALGEEGRMSPDARVVLLSYPYLELGGYKYGGYAAGDAVRALGERADIAARQAVAHVNGVKGYEFAFFLDTVKGKFAGHEPHGSPWKRNPDRWLHEFLWDTGWESKEWYHPNSLGHQGYADVLIPNGAFVPIPLEPRLGHVDLTFVVDASSSMGPDVAALQGFADEFIDGLESGTRTGFVGLASYRDDPAWTGVAGDYAGRLDFPLRTIRGGGGDDFVDVVGGLSAGGGGDHPDTVFSGLVAATDQRWRNTVKG